MKILRIRIYWQWWRLFRKGWYTGNRLRFKGFEDKKKEYKILWDFGALTIAMDR